MASPWGRGPTSWIWFAAIAAALTVLVVWIAADRGGLPDDPERGSRIIHGVVIAALIAAGLVHGRRIGFKGALGAAFAWLAIGGLLVLGYSYRFELQTLWQRVAGELVPDAAVRSGPRSLSVRRADDGHFYLTAEVNGRSLRFLVDTGASDTVLGPEHARRVGIDPARLAFTRRYRTANGMVLGAPVRLKSFAVGPLVFENIPASVNAVPLGKPLLGIATLKLFKSWTVENDRLTLRY